MSRRSRRPDLVVSEERGVRHLHVGGEAIQSAMRMDDPFALELDYTRCMMAFLLFHPQPRRADCARCTSAARRFRARCVSTIRMRSRSTTRAA